MPVVPGMTQTLKQEDHKFKASLSYIVKPCLKGKILKDSIYNISFPPQI
jgi:hypothetical protein